ncbi:hypothetical protein CCH79_00001038 [Gambusia affinis]|uniref:Uncharacterized protein n=1 Tax=Gambusia affinis TaxID=33528 RepID=A0A315VUH6_GAMAF|nr:hypothetical protein CCH79_00001038 [Gambusia affinis]
MRLKITGCFVYLCLCDTWKKRVEAGEAEERVRAGRGGKRIRAVIVPGVHSVGPNTGVTEGDWYRTGSLFHLFVLSGLPASLRALFPTSTRQECLSPTQRHRRTDFTGRWRLVLILGIGHLAIPWTGSWVELEELIAAVSRRESLTGPQDSISSALQGELERILLEAQLECERSRDSPPQVVTPRSTSSPTRPTSEQDSDCVPIQEEVERQVDTDWVWDWSSRPENMPLKEFVFQHPKQPGSLSVRKTEVMKRGIFSSDVLLILVPSLLASHLLTLGVGKFELDFCFNKYVLGEGESIYIGKRLATSSASTL